MKIITQRISMSMIRILLLIAALVSLSPAQATPGQPLPAQAWHRKAVGFSIGLYYLTLPGTDPAKAARDLAADRRFALQVVDKLDQKADSQALLRILYSSNVASDYAPPSLRSLHYFGHGLSLEQAEALQKAPRALILTFAHPASQSITGLRRAEQFVAELAKRDRAIIWDDETREAFTSDAWELQRLKTWDRETPDVSKQIVIHAYNNGGPTRAVSLGMARFGMPDLVVNDSTWSLNRPLGLTIDAVTQQLVEAGPPGDNGALQLKLASSRHATVRRFLTESVLSGGKGEGQLRLLEAPAEAGDPNNALASLNFDAYPGRDITERQTNFVRTVYGAQPDDVAYVRESAALLAAIERARARLPALQQAFQRGLAPGEQLQVKAPFNTRDGNREWMWIDVTEWQGDRIKGMLRNTPRNVPGLKAGQMVEARQSELFDYFRIFPDGRTEGNETSGLLR
ncbi:DUF2314 domain-containing protein [Ralstonia pseudosolanacearum]|uniref:DUF2314 domain-containing protein n=1 Tax=Ralstonia pseudosolanacearum TaxID=1310165 RepID=UPI0012683DBE|nr:DUF2314 domain-containing protein [Ralstonia pseudosolanacearum]MDO3507390.1 DUF2314 domain-containing protein [Ralstonia pseudosolanacearum]MDO3512790.1 DUF2314 domain-containing protein [Ralstonia pseudosolanacearum]MDO3537164.1 DUF2314 domain-containing protein [Ralstonia pseudosolanacearum]MDO3557415.1 DUF2314 domain-containing protein [Ralstonia pseudosolanacearum]MDO3579236.1 DUF2314 domain-containing protein [Ralstonia pseudosolanacearum]